MTTTEHIEPGVLGAKRASWRRGNTRKLLLEIMAGHPKATESKWQSLFLDAIKEDAQRWMDGEVDNENSLFITTVYSHFANVKIAVERGAAAPDETAVTARKEEQEKAVSRVKEAVKQRVADEARIMLLQLEMPNGKTLGRCNKKDCESIGGWASEIAKQLPNARKCVDEVFSQDQLWALWKKHK